MMTRRTAIDAGVFVLLVALAAGSRLADLAPNFAAVTAVALFAGFYFRSAALAAAAPLAAMIASDAVIGFYDWRVLAVVYAALLAPVLLGRVMGRQPGPWRVAAGAVGASASFFIATNFAVWAAGWYPPTVEGLAACYVAALPFLKYTLAGDLLFSAALFGAHAAATSRVGGRALAAAPAAA